MRSPGNSGRRRLVVVALVGALCTAFPIGLGAQNIAARVAYDKVRARYFVLKSDPKRRSFRHHWLNLIGDFQGIYRIYPESEEALKARYTEGSLWAGLGEVSGKVADIDAALVAYERVLMSHPASSYADDALLAQTELLLKRDRQAAAHLVLRILAEYPKGDMALRAKVLWKSFSPRLQKRTQLAGKSLRPKRSGASLLRIEEEAVAGKYRLRFISRSTLWGRLQVEKSEPEERRGGKVGLRVILSAPGLGGQKIGGWKAESQGGRVIEATCAVGSDGCEIVLALPRDAAACELKIEATLQERVLECGFGVEESRRVSQNGQVMGPEGVARRVVLDPGHGGSDAGAVGYGIREKDVTLAIARRAHGLLVAQGYDVRLTRGDDHYVALAERSQLANQVSADLFVSIHANSHDDSSIYGIETYYLDTRSSGYALRLAEVENQGSKTELSSLNLLVANIAKGLYTEDSKYLAQVIQEELVEGLASRYPKIKGLGVKGALFHVLLGADMPAVLVETSFLSNSREAKRLASRAYQEGIGEALAKAIQEYFQHDGVKR